MILSSGRHSGFTLIEMTIVMLITALAAGLVAPLTFKALAKAQAKTEYLQLRNIIKAHTTKAFAQGLRYRMELVDNQLVVQSTLGTRSFKYQHLGLPKQVFFINSNGYPSIDFFAVQVGEQTRKITLEDMLGVKQDSIYAKIK